MSASSFALVTEETFCLVSMEDCCDTSVPTRASAPERASVSPSASHSDISRDIDTDIQNAASKMKESDQVEDQSEDMPFDPNLVYPKCGKHFRVGETPNFRKHVTTAH